MKHTFDEKLLINVLAQQSYSEQTKQFRKWIRAKATELMKGCAYHIYVDNGNLYIRKGNAELYPCIVSHMDTVHKMKNNIGIYRSRNRLFAFDETSMEQYGIGGDDKVGVYICLQMLRTLPDVKVAFFRDEETGCKGSQLADAEFFDDVAFVLQCDRRGYNDYITKISGAEICSEEWIAAIQPLLTKYKYRKESGMMTDVEALKQKGIDVCMNNMSCGYYNPHTDREYVDISDVHNCENMVYEIMSTMAWKRWEHTYKFTGYKSSTGSTGAYGLWGGGDWEGYGSTYNRDWEKDYDWVRGVGWVRKKDDANKIKNEDDDKKHGRTDYDRECLACGTAGMLYDSHSEDWYCWSCSMYEKEINSVLNIRRKSQDEMDTEEGGNIV